MNIDHIYIITINDTRENYNDVLNRIIEIGLPHRCQYEFRGVNGYELTKDDLDSYGISLYPHWNVLTATTDLGIHDTENKFWKRDMTRGEIGCVLSHLQIWEDAYENGYENIIIFEDDIISNETKFDWGVLTDLQSLNYDLFYLGRLPQLGFEGVVDTPLEEYPHLCTPGYSYQAHAYMLSKNGIAKIVEQYLPILKKNLVPSDDFLPAICNWTPREDLNDLFPGLIRGYGLTDWGSGILQMRTEDYGNSMTMPNND
jgi:hypothetical protein